MSIQYEILLKTVICLMVVLIEGSKKIQIDLSLLEGVPKGRLVFLSNSFLHALWTHKTSPTSQIPDCAIVKTMHH